MDQHFVLDRLNMQAHHDAQSCSDEFIKEELVVQDRLSFLVVELVVTEAWQDRALPLLRSHLAEHIDPVLVYQLLYHEAVVSNLLEVILHHPDAAEALSEEAALELCDWCARKLAALGASKRSHRYGEKNAGPPHARARGVRTRHRDDHLRWYVAAVHSARELLEMLPAAELAAREEEVQLSVGLSALTTLRHLSDHMQRLSLGVAARMAGTHDAVGLLLPLLASPPWERTGSGGALLRWEGGAWRRTSPAERHVVCAAEAQAWLLLYNVFMDPICASKADLGESRVDSLLRLRPRLTPHLLAQLPLLRGLQRALEELALGAHRPSWNPSGGEAAVAKVVIEQAPGLRAAVLAQTDWVALAERQRREQFGAGGAGVGLRAAQAMLQGFDFLSDLESAAGDNDSKPRAPPRAATLDAFLCAGGGRWVWHASYRLEVLVDSKPEAVRVEPPPAGGAGSSPAPVDGKRFRLGPLSEGGSRALPARGKLVLAYGGHSCEAVVDLPAPDTRW